MNKKTLIIVAVAVVILLSVGATLAFRGNGNETLHTVKTETLEEQVQSSGKTKPAQEVELGFVSSGKIARSYASVGKLVENGEVLMQLEAADLYADLAKAKADVAAESATFANDTENAEEALQKAIIVVDNTIRNTIDQFYEGARTSNAKFRPVVFIDGEKTALQLDYSIREDLGDARSEISSVLRSLDSLKSKLNNVNDAKTYIDEIKGYITQVQDFVDDIASGMNRIEVNEEDAVTQLNTFKTQVADARFDLQELQSEILSAENEINTTLSQSNSGAALTERDARVLKARAEVQSIEAEIAKTIIRSPIQGIVTKVEADPGEIVSSGTTIIGVISDDNFEIESNISEVNISKVHIDNIVRITFDGINGREFWGKVVYIEPAETIVDDVVTFKVKVALDEVTPDIKSGLTANLTISTNTKENVIAIPAYAVMYKAGKAFVQKRINEKESVETEIQTGIIGSNGYIEILSGLKEGDVIAIIAD